MTQPLHQQADPRVRLLERVSVIILIVIFGGFAVPSALIVFSEERVGAVMVLAFWAWFTFRGVIQLRDPRASRDARFWFTSAAGYAVLALILLALQMWEDARGNLDTQSVSLSVMVILLLMLTVLAGRIVATREKAEDPSPTRARVPK